VSSNRSESRVFIGLIEISGYYGRIVDELRRAGHTITFREISTHQFNYESQSSRMDYRYEHLLSPKFGERWSVKGAVKRRLVGVHFFMWSICNHDVFVFVYGESFWKNNRDLFLLRLLKKRIVAFVAHGSEARPAFMDGAHWSTAIKTPDPIAYIYKQFKNQRKKIARIEHCSDLVVAHPLTSQLLKRPAVAAMYIGLPAPNVQNHYQSQDESEIHIMHAPSNRKAKGSDEIASIVQKVSVDHPNILYTELTETSNDEVLTRIAKSQIVIDQMYSDTYLAGLGTEAASLGVAVLVGSYGVLELKEHIHQDYLPPALVVHPKEIEKSLIRLVEDRAYRESVANACESFVSSNWTVKSVADRFLLVVNGNCPKEWYFDPLTVSYVHGSGLEEYELLNIWKTGLERFGRSFLNIPDRPDLYSKMQNLLKDSGPK
jgi:hypothetical protein